MVNTKLFLQRPWRDFFTSRGEILTIFVTGLINKESTGFVLTMGGRETKTLFASSKVDDVAAAITGNTSFEQSDLLFLLVYSSPPVFLPFNLASAVTSNTYIKKVFLLCCNEVWYFRNGCVPMSNPGCGRLLHERWIWRQQVTLRRHSWKEPTWAILRKVVSSQFRKLKRKLTSVQIEEKRNLIDQSIVIREQGVSNTSKVSVLSLSLPRFWPHLCLGFEFWPYLCLGLTLSLPRFWPYLCLGFDPIFA